MDPSPPADNRCSGVFANTCGIRTSAHGAISVGERHLPSRTHRLKMYSPKRIDSDSDIVTFSTLSQDPGRKADHSIDDDVAPDQSTSS